MPIVQDVFQTMTSSRNGHPRTLNTAFCKAAPSFRIFNRQRTFRYLKQGLNYENNLNNQHRNRTIQKTFDLFSNNFLWRTASVPCRLRYEAVAFKIASCWRSVSLLAPWVWILPAKRRFYHRFQRNINANRTYNAFLSPSWANINNFYEILWVSSLILSIGRGITLGAFSATIPFPSRPLRQCKYQRIYTIHIFQYNDNSNVTFKNIIP